MIANKSYKYQVTFVINTNFHTLYYGPVCVDNREKVSSAPLTMMVERRDGGGISWLRLGACKSSPDHGLGPASRGGEYSTAPTARAVFTSLYCSNPQQ